MRFNFISVALLFFSASVFSLGMGDLQIQSFLNQPFYGEIKLIDVGNIPLSGIQAFVAPVSDFERIGLSYDDDLDKLNFKIRKNAKGEAVIVLTSTESINEPYLELVVDLVWSNGELYRAYTLLLDPPDKPAVKQVSGSEKQKLTEKNNLYESAITKLPAQHDNFQVGTTASSDLVSGLKYQLALLKESNQHLQAKTVQHDQDIASLKQQLNILLYFAQLHSAVF